MNTRKTMVLDTQQVDTCVFAHADKELITSSTLHSIHQALNQQGWVLLRGFDTSLEKFASLMEALCTHLTFDPAREYGNQQAQKVNAGKAAVGLHIENGNTPFPPDVVAFYSRKSAAHGSQTTVCDGHEVYQNMSDELKALFRQPMTMTRRLPQHIWKQYVFNELKTLSSVEEVTEAHLQMLLEASQATQASYLDDEQVLHFCLTSSPVIHSKFSGLAAFANTILGPSFNYEVPTFTLHNGETISAALKLELEALCERYTHEVQWQDGDVVVMDNTRVMHGRRAITVDLENRELFIGMGMR
ncbi:MAG: TauD/TfdA family dioxygenase [Formosimonas sp.]